LSSSGSGVVKVKGHNNNMPLTEKTLTYIPPAQHNVTNTGTEVLEYVWVTAPTNDGKYCCRHHFS
jgi:mannose-6-phosphate isomerase-like protein (cupin superfamily)